MSGIDSIVMPVVDRAEAILDGFGLMTGNNEVSYLRTTTISSRRPCSTGSRAFIVGDCFDLLVFVSRA